ncbi:MULTISPECIES: hypothetical protein [unclassified Streptomyces]|uniref:hypothetical protein n=1 Tax=unclassified Streptomyces TaxID=2593676 RepID=UPI002366869A|nr:MULTISPECIES: hypothetical protein [unclassified Streptomyces]MDF3141619.1 hypothetical protein [Streptomyces sp. T21Q-yed]WDF37380.1 hypothetical protein PBV52_11550 [Streptomyces sp. T12]
MTPAIPYDSHAAHPTPLTFSWTITSRGDEVVHEAKGNCPVCGCAMTRRWTFGQHPLTKGGFLGRREKPGAEPYHTLCRCRTVHLGRPAQEEFGCGALLPIAPPPSPDDGRSAS